MFFLSRPLFGPPKAPRNIFFPWWNFVLHRSGAFLERNRVAFRVPIHLTKFEIREYLRRLYGIKVIKVNTMIKIYHVRKNLHVSTMGYYRTGPRYKKAVCTLEEAVPDEVKMLGGHFGGGRRPGRNPAIIKKNWTTGQFKAGIRYKSWVAPAREHMREMGINRGSWRHPIPNLLAGDEWEMNPRFKLPEDKQMAPDKTKPFFHNWTGRMGASPRKPGGTPKQTEKNFPHMDFTPWRREVQRLKGAISGDPQAAQPQSAKQQVKNQATYGPWTPPS